MTKSSASTQFTDRCPESWISAANTSKNMVRIIKVEKVTLYKKGVNISPWKRDAVEMQFAYCLVNSAI